MERFNWYIKQIDIGRKSPAYLLLLKIQPEAIPEPPAYNYEIGKRSLTGLIQQWRRNLNFIAYREYKKQPNLELAGDFITDEEYHILIEKLNTARKNVKKYKREQNKEKYQEAVNYLKIVKDKVMKYEVLFIPEQFDYSENKINSFFSLYLFRQSPRVVRFVQCQKIVNVNQICLIRQTAKGSTQFLFTIKVDSTF